MADAEHEGERRSRLRQYQVQLLERMQAAQATGAAAARELGVLIGARHCLLDLTQVGEIVPFQPATAVPLTQPWYLGLANVRGNLVGVIDLGAYLAAEPADSSASDPAFDPAARLPAHLLEHGPAHAPEHFGDAVPAGTETRLLTFAAAIKLPCALLASRVFGLRRLADMQPAATGTAAPAWCAGRYVDTDGQSWTRLDLARLAREPRFLHVGP